jgi:hypothetical protein
MTAQRSARIVALLLLVVAIFQLAVVLGAPLGDYTQGGVFEGTLPATGRIVAGVSILIVGVMAAAMLARAGLGPLASAPPRLVTILAWLTTAYSCVAVVVNLITPSAVERMVWEPISIVILVLVIVTMAKTRTPSSA